jgi:hypothetical protein
MQITSKKFAAIDQFLAQNALVNQAATTQNYYKKLLLSYSINPPPFAAAMFKLANVKIINNFFRSIKLIINYFTTKPIL